MARQRKNREKRGDWGRVRSMRGKWSSSDAEYWGDVEEKGGEV